MSPCMDSEDTTVAAPIATGITDDEVAENEDDERVEEGGEV